jgi:hypothetical protein
LKFNSWIARHSVPIAAYTTLYPFPFNVEDSYSDGAFQGIKLGKAMDEAIAVLSSSGHCKVTAEGRLLEMGYVKLSAYNDGELVMRCISGGVAWNQILVIQDKAIRQARVAGGLWL